MWRLLLPFVFIPNLLAQPLDLMLLEKYQNQSIEGWVMSEKLDGVRGFWDGKQLLSRQNYPLSAPDYFTENFPPFAIDGELFSERRQFDNISAIIRGSQPQQWQKLKLYVFDVPNASGDLFDRLRQLDDYLKSHPTPYIEIIKQIPIQDKAHLTHFFEHIKKSKGEGIVIRNPQASYINGRSTQILKFKAVYDDECTVTAHHLGKGKYQGKMGSVSCSNSYGKFKIGSGFSDKDRANPPAIGSVITYKYRGFTSKGKPRFATFWRIRQDN
ncbi:DNA ligase [Phocoenobacter skyensis]|uniref:DNA ligase n=1 Tax=Phocoenobacter skyensis TaxID=97481 RepID=A0A1H7Y0V1_9PAST|nr:DNA ligase [Pasteurella skyensis]MDP8079777.1 DNA ligase [Pasteurella skyensis]MDP8085754.1 DNA ligase [Pasteurella skyensis]MDP8171152.1 DNA ligase [Pasteurella skyensis]MDP8175013.1 DNA ligase [Pasteurella skyensis]MDP8185582.1 DNA ligase [Pasteurella skyensis]